jgi:hypothetical protein
LDKHVISGISDYFPKPSGAELDQQNQKSYKLVNGNDESFLSLKSSAYLRSIREGREARNLETGTVYQVLALGTGTVHLGRGRRGLQGKARA